MVPLKTFTIMAELARLLTELSMNSTEARNMINFFRTVTSSDKTNDNFDLS